MATTGSYEDLFRKEIAKYDHLCEEITKNIDAQEQLLLQIQEAKEKFQFLQKVISIPGDEEKMTLYNQTGFVDDIDFASKDADNLQEFFRSVYKKVTEADIEEFEANYRGSESENNDLKDI